ncbi:hypothetical protein N500_0660 [Wolbachia pipientis wUni]|nr:hypothetical protein N500_0660 [Wolbachia pipientis wUni]
MVVATASQFSQKFDVIPVSSTGMTLFSGGGCSQVTTFV